MSQEHQIISRVYTAKDDMDKTDDLIREYIPFIKKEVSKYLSRVCSEQDDEFSIGMMAFHEAILGYEKQRGAFLSYAALTIRSRLIDYSRKQERHLGLVSLDEECGEDKRPLSETLPDKKDVYSEMVSIEATREEIEEFGSVLSGFGISLSDIADNSPKQERTFAACSKTVKYAIGHPELLDEMMLTKKLPMQKLTSGTGVERKTLERHRKYVLALLLIQTNGYEIIRSHTKGMLKQEGEMPV